MKIQKIFFIFPLFFSLKVFAAQPIFVGSGSCSSSACHGGVGHNQDQYTKWSVSDKHSEAYDVLFNERSKKMAEILELGKAHENEFCLGCHATKADPPSRGPQFDLHEGIGCESCHGAASQWLEPHALSGNSHQKNLELGMRDLKNSSVRAETCFKCHTSLEHRVYAAGHPEITFELDTFSALMPRHWEQKIKWEGAKIWSLGQIVSFREFIRHLGETTKKNRSLDESTMNCFSCHHHLYDDNWKIQSKTTGKARWDLSRWLLLKQNLQVSFPDVSAQLNPLVDKLKNLYHQPTSTSPAEAQKISSEIEKILDSLLSHQSSQIINENTIQEIMKSISNDAQNYREGGYRSAEQAVMALDSLSLSMAQSTGKKRPFEKEIKALYDVLNVKDPASYDENKFADQIAIFSKTLEKIPRNTSISITENPSWSSIIKKISQ